MNMAFSIEDIKAALAAGYKFDTARALFLKGQSLAEVLAEAPEEQKLYSRRQAKNLKKWRAYYGRR